MGYLVNFGKRDDPHPPSKKHRLSPEMLCQDMDAACPDDVLHQELQALRVQKDIKHRVGEKLAAEQDKLFRKVDKCDAEVRLTVDADGQQACKPTQNVKEALAKLDGLLQSWRTAVQDTQDQMRKSAQASLQSSNSMATVTHDLNGRHTLEIDQLLHEWDFERNAADGIHPNNTTLGSNELVHWVCKKCLKGHLHRYQMRPFNRTGRDCAGCPHCAGQQACECNSLQAGYPVISSEWDYARNDMTPADVTTRSHLVVWWKNNLRGSWLQRIAERTEPRGKPKQ